MEFPCYGFRDDEGSISLPQLKKALKSCGIRTPSDDKLASLAKKMGASGKGKSVTISRIAFLEWIKPMDSTQYDDLQTLGHHSF